MSIEGFLVKHSGIRINNATIDRLWSLYLDSQEDTDIYLVNFSLPDIWSAILNVNTAIFWPKMAVSSRVGIETTTLSM